MTTAESDSPGPPPTPLPVPPPLAATPVERAGDEGVALPPMISARHTPPAADRRGRGRRPGGARVAGPARRREVSAERARAALAHCVVPPIDPDDIHLVASEGFPFWEPVEVMIHRNQRITVGYADLSRRLAAAIASGDPGRDANWCSFATWSSYTIGRKMERLTHRSGYAAATVGPRGRLQTVAGWLRPDRTVRKVVSRSEAASLRVLAAGNRLVFLEVGLAIATFLDHFPDRTFIAPDDDVDARWAACWSDIADQLEVFTRLDPTWVPTTNPPRERLRSGIRQYLLAMLEDDPRRRSQHVLAGSLLVAHYEQQRVDGYVWAALALFTDAAMLRLLRDQTGLVGGVRKLPSSLFARYLTKQITLELAGERIDVCQPILGLAPSSPAASGPVSPASASGNGGPAPTGIGSPTEVTLPLLQVLATRYRLSLGRWPDTGARNWSSFYDRMQTIGNLFQARQQQPELLRPPFGPKRTEALLAGSTPGDVIATALGPDV